MLRQEKKAGKRQMVYPSFASHAVALMVNAKTSPRQKACMPMELREREPLGSRLGS